MNGHRHEEPRLTPEQRDRVLDIAARLKAQDEGAVAMSDLARAAEEAGIEARYVHEAYRLMARTEPLPRSLGVTLGAFTLQATFFVFIQNVWIGGNRSVSAFELSFAAALAFFLGLWAARVRPVRPFVPLVALGVWFALFLATTAFEAIQGVRQGWVIQDCVVFGLSQAVAAAFGAIATAALERIDRRGGLPTRGSA